MLTESELKRKLEIQKRIIIEDGQGFFGFIYGLKQRFDEHPTLSEQFKRGDAANADEIIYVLLQALQCHFAAARQLSQTSAAPTMTVDDIFDAYEDEFAFLKIQSWFNNLEGEIARLRKSIATASNAKFSASRDDVVNTIIVEIDKQLVQRKSIFEMSKQYRETNKINQYRIDQQTAAAQAAEQQAAKLHAQLNKNETASTHLMMQQLVYGQRGEEGSSSSASASTSDSPPRALLQPQQPTPSTHIQYESFPQQRGTAPQPITHPRTQAVDPRSSQSATSSASSSPDNSEDPSPIQLLTGMSGGLYQEKPMELPTGVAFIGRSRRYFAPQDHYNILIVDAEIPKNQKGKNGAATFGPGRALYDLAITNSQNPTTQQAMTNIFGRVVKFHYLAYDDFIKIDKSMAGKSVRKITKEVDFVFAYPLGSDLDSILRNFGYSHATCYAHKNEAAAFAIAFVRQQVLCQDKLNSHPVKGPTELCFSNDMAVDGSVKPQVIWGTTQRIVLNTDNQSAFFALLMTTQAYARNEWARAENENHASGDYDVIDKVMRKKCAKLTYPAI